MNKNLIVIGGPTGIGKTDLSIRLAKKMNSEIISADSRQFYKELNIGVAKPDEQQLKQIKHHFINHLSINQYYSVGEYEREALILINKLFKKNDTLFLCGGSGLYIDSITEGLHKFPKISTTIQEQLQNDLKEKGLEYLNQELKSIDFETYRIIDTQNPRRVMRALEIYRTTKIPYSEYKKASKKERNFKTIFLCLKQNRETLYNNINTRVDTMMKNGLLKEVESLYNDRHLQALQTIGYKEIFEYIQKKRNLEDTILEIKKNTRRYAKRQINWFNNIKYKNFTINQEHQILEYIQKTTGNI